MIGTMTRHEQHRPPHTPCPLDQLEWFVNRTLPTEERADIEAHLAACAACRAEVADWTGLREAMQGVRARTPEPRADLFARIERQIDLSPQPHAWPSLRSLPRMCWLALTVTGELFRAQARLVRRDLFWVQLLLVPLAGLVVYLSRSTQEVPETAALLAALLTALGMAFLYGQEVDPARELALTTRTSPRLVLGIRCCLVFGCDLLLNCGLVLPLLAWKGMVTPGWFLVNWLAPLCCLSAIALLLSTLTSPGTAVSGCALLWVLRLLDHTHILQDVPWQRQYEGFWHQAPLLFAVALLAVLLAFTLLERKERFA
jgi:hypothetical protein